MTAVTLVPQQTAAHDVVFRKIREEMTLMAIGLSGADAIPVHIVADDGAGGGSVISAAASQEGTAVELTVDNNTIHLEPPMTISVTKGTTTGIAGIFLTNRSDI